MRDPPPLPSNSSLSQVKQQARSFGAPTRIGCIDLIAIVSARKAKSRAQLTTMRTTVAYRGTKLFFCLTPSILTIL